MLLKKSKFKPLFLHNFYFRKLFSTKAVNSAYFSKIRNSTIFLPFLLKKVKLYNGRKYITVSVRKSMLGSSFGAFSLSKYYGSTIHQRKTKKSRKKK